MEEIEYENQILLFWDNDFQGAKIFFLVSWSNNIENQITIDFKGWIVINPSLFKFTAMHLNLKGFLKYLPRKRALKDFGDLINFLKGNPEKMIHNQLEMNKFYFKLIFGFLLRWLIFLPFAILLLSIFVVFNSINLILVGLSIDFLLITILFYWNKRKKKFLNQ
ncbi:MAG: hypothetical protein HeimC3_32460 [Candidatus Heimdallarchaeota archaeon LC_3]|nr:MAG: hypothetical protein HeimC3_32460 [Candidatus Heimdallarchaeota archaeon LC_3]